MIPDPILDALFAASIVVCSLREVLIAIAIGGGVMAVWSFVDHLRAARRSRELAHRLREWQL